MNNTFSIVLVKVHPTQDLMIPKEKKPNKTDKKIGRIKNTNVNNFYI